jgi:hypothetical protein
MLKNIRENTRLQLLIGLALGVVFGFLLQKGGATRYDIIIGQLLLEDFTVVKIMLSAVLVGMIGIHIMRGWGIVRLHPKPGSLGSSVIGGLIFGAGFGLLGYCPGTVAGAVGQGSLDALFGGFVGILAGAGLFAALYPKIEKGILKKGDFGEATIPQLLKVNPWAVVIPVAVFIIALLFLIQRSGL